MASKIEISFSPMCNFIARLRFMPLLIICVLTLVVGFSINTFYPMQNFFIKALVLILILIIAIMAEKKYIVLTKSITIKLQGSRNNIIIAANQKLKNRVISAHNYWIPFLFISFFGGSSIILKLISCNTLGFFCFAVFIIIVFFSIVGYLQYFYLFLYIIDISKADFTDSGVNYDRTYPAKTDWIIELTQLYHLYRNCFFAAGSLYIVAFYLFTSNITLSMFKNIGSLSVDETIVMLCWAVIAIAIVLLFPISSIVNYIKIEKIVVNLKTSEVRRLQKKITKHKKECEYIPLIISIWETADYPFRDIVGWVFSGVVSVINIVTTIYPILYAFF